ncbi:hypothetical protein [Ethanoligenens harbinense]|uniref:Uncharacterized protein n=1 Tax=Ethanoligenens harbinense (strain DSM 18485 / JCM 12961 / CGMCC 1.5033 / YUAN-3) TaxID=663278 RepID=E6U803_ETHHY|nr:hypothetical protein [Ethanoligenens harbinense]ADU25935.1 hypothetical protein Ethha_0349 [Ethanoligenens harbinense YUAN-3]AVQ95088.1 hypothetical protein CXQ68_01800 [Ethanoligenens harbinense YUAN-3]AYF37779.1 hypothetical protein CXP51_01810 [Ethanoligenens harbinense]AYF40501.1 hypothetical protein CN246_01805 [Ethanoligenens harbinense]QCN91334.1 hypothetical protein DRA42_01810 [Ethanoligenens harbinense]
MYSRNELLVIGLFVLSLLIAAGAATMLALHLLFLPFFVPLAVSLAFGVVFAGLIIVLAAAGGRENAEHHRRVLCGCGNAYLRPAIVSAVVALVVALIFSGTPPFIPVLSAALFGLTVLFLLFAIFLLAAFIFCVLDSTCHYCPCGDDARSEDR